SLTPGGSLKNAISCSWFRGRVTDLTKRIFQYHLPPNTLGQVNGPAFTGRETGGPDCSLHIRNLTLTDSGNYTRPRPLARRFSAEGRGGLRSHRAGARSTGRGAGSEPGTRPSPRPSPAMGRAGPGRLGQSPSGRRRSWPAALLGGESGRGPFDSPSFSVSPCTGSPAACIPQAGSRAGCRTTVPINSFLARMKKPDQQDWGWNGLIDVLKALTPAIHSCILLTAASILSSCLPLTQAQEVIPITRTPENPRTGQNMTLRAGGTLEKVVLCSWFRGTVTDVTKRIFVYYLPPLTQGQVNGPSYTGRETAGPDCSLHIRNLTLNDSGNYTLSKVGAVTAVGHVTIEFSVHEIHGSPLRDTTQWKGSLKQPETWKNPSTIPFQGV
uniref:Immunoglobulin V-set domain-containing protein n=1 Tax=Varanus komodoensis TaxID=61221 RepID=A0A8D2JJ09_VARKO